MGFYSILLPYIYYVYMEKRKHKVLIFIIPVTGNRWFRRDFLTTVKTHKLKLTLISAEIFQDYSNPRKDRGFSLIFIEI